MHELENKINDMTTEELELFISRVEKEFGLLLHQCEV
jgi:hypothetical protein